MQSKQFVTMCIVFLLFSHILTIPACGCKAWPWLYCSVWESNKEKIETIEVLLFFITNTLRNLCAHLTHTHKNTTHQPYIWLCLHMRTSTPTTKNAYCHTILRHQLRGKWFRAGFTLNDIAQCFDNIHNMNMNCKLPGKSKIRAPDDDQLSTIVRFQQIWQCDLLANARLCWRISQQPQVRV